jgi:hypothetical protein
MELNQIFAGRQACQVVQASNLFRDRLHPHHQYCDMIHSWLVIVKQNVVCLYPVETDNWHPYHGLGKIFIFFRPTLKSIQSPLLCPGVFQTGYLLASGAEFKEFPDLGITTVCTTLNRVREERLPFRKTKHSTNVRKKRKQWIRWKS